MKLVISDAHEGIKAAVAKILHVIWQRCRVNFMRNASPMRVAAVDAVSASIATAFAQDDAEAAKRQWRRVAEQLRAKLPKLAALMDEAGADAPRVYELPGSASCQAALHQSDRATQ